MAANAKQKMPILKRIEHSLAEVAHAPTVKAVHAFRTSSRRLEAFAELRKGEGARSLRKVERRLEKPLHLAGRVRDLDVQIESLRDLHVDADRDARRRLLADLQEVRDRAARKLGKSLDKRTVQSLTRKIRKVARAQRSSAKSRAEHRLRAWTEALSLVAALPQDFPEVEQKNLHRLRLACKSIRYTAEQAFPMPDAVRFAEVMKDAQDAIGRWHDWMLLRERAQELVPEEGPLHRVLHSQERASLSAALRRGREIVRPQVLLADKKKPGAAGVSTQAATGS